MIDDTRPDPDVKLGLEYWATQPASYDGVLGGFGTGTLPRIDALGSRQFLLALLPALCTVPSALRPLEPTPRTRRVRALDVGAGVGRVTSDTLLPLIDDVILLEPVEIFIREAAARGTAAEAGGSPAWRGISTREKSVTFVQGTLQGVDPAAPAAHGTVLARVGAPIKDTEEMDSGFDVVWCQWCLGHLTDADLVRFLRRAQAALRDAESVIVVKENLCSEGEDGQAKSVYDEQDSSLTRSDLAFKKIFQDAGLRLVKQQIQAGFPDEIYDVKMYALRPEAWKTAL